VLCASLSAVGHEDLSALFARRFKLQQVRSDPVQFPYLMMPSLEAWQVGMQQQQRYFESGFSPSLTSTSTVFASLCSTLQAAAAAAPEGFQHAAQAELQPQMPAVSFSPRSCLPAKTPCPAATLLLLLFLFARLPVLQSCSANPAEDDQGFPCITKLAKNPAVAPIVEDQHAINVFVAGAPRLLLPLLLLLLLLLLPPLLLLLLLLS
jgi:hypothetical protein